MDETIHIIGGGLAGSEAAYMVSRLGGRAVLYEMKPEAYSPAHSLSTLAELVCSNSLKSLDPGTASGLLKEEMRLLGSLVVRAAEATRVAAGNTLAVDRTAFSEYVTRECIEAGVTLVTGEVSKLPEGRPLIIATGPLTSDALAGAINTLVGMENLYFFDAVAPIVYKESIDMDVAFFATRYDKGPPDYINCPMDKAEYDRFVSELLGAKKTTPHAFESTPLFEGCMPIEAMAERGQKTLAFGPMRPVGLTDPRTNARPYAVVQLRRENAEGTLYNMVGFQTRMTFGEQTRVFRLIPGLGRAEFARLGKLHRNTFICSPALLDHAQGLRTDPGVYFAGQITGVEGYCESAASGLLAGLNALRHARGLAPAVPPPSTMTGALLGHVTGPGGEGGVAEGAGPAARFQPMNANFGLLPDPGIRGKEKRRKEKAARALAAMSDWANLYLAT